MRAGAEESHDAPVRPSVLPNNTRTVGAVYKHQGVEVSLEEQRSHDPRASSSSQPIPTDNSMQDSAHGQIEEPVEDETEEGEQIERRQNGHQRMMKDVKYPSREEIEEHNKTHSPFQEWCRYCVRGRATNSQHKSRLPEDELSTIPSMSMDYLVTLHGPSADIRHSHVGSDRSAK